MNKLKKYYDNSFVPDEHYLDDLPDLQNGEYKTNLPIQEVGIHGMLLPFKIRQKDGGYQDVCANISGMVSLEAEKKGINMSRIGRTLHKYTNTPIDMSTICSILEDYKNKIGSFDAHIQMKFKYRMWQDALRSVDEKGNKEGEWMYYDICFDMILDKNDVFRKVLRVDFIYSSACPCSTALSEHAAMTRGIYGIPHSQRSVARLYLELIGDDIIWIEDIVNAMRDSLTTECQTFVKRIDEQAFAEKNGADPKFVEDAIRRIGNVLNDMDGVKDYKVICSHNESLHVHNAISVLIKGISNTQFSPVVSFEEFDSLNR